MKLNYTCKFNFRGPQNLCDTNLCTNAQWEKNKNVQFCNILNTLQLFIDIVVSPSIKKVMCDKFTSQVVPRISYCIIRLYF